MTASQVEAILLVVLAAVLAPCVFFVVRMLREATREPTQRDYARAFGTLTQDEDP